MKTDLVSSTSLHILRDVYDVDIAPKSENPDESSPIAAGNLAESLMAQLTLRTHAIAYSVAQTAAHNLQAISDARTLITSWMRTKAIVRVLGAGRALLAASMPGNRLAHAGAQVSFMGGVVPLPNSVLGGGVLACSASGKTKPVLEAMAIAKRNNPAIQIIGFALADAIEFMKHCDVFIGIHTEGKTANPLSALADMEEYVIAELLDGLVVAAGKALGFDDDGWRRGHEDIGPTGPYSPSELSRSR